MLNLFVTAGEVGSVNVFITNDNKQEDVYIHHVIPLYKCTNIAISDLYNLTNEEKVISKYPLLRGKFYSVIMTMMLCFWLICSTSICYLPLLEK